jgi:hypothetical protein
VVLKPDEIPDSGAMEGRSRLQVVDPEAAQRLTAATHLELPELLPAEDIPAQGDRPAAATPRARTAERRRSDAGRDFMRYWARVDANHRRTLRQAREAPDSAIQRAQIAEWMYWSHLTELVDALREAPVRD